MLTFRWSRDGLDAGAEGLVEIAARLQGGPNPLLADSGNFLDVFQQLAALLPRLRNVGDWTGAALEAVVRSYAEEAGAKLGTVAQPMRAALTGRSTSPGIFDVLTVLGREESLGRIEDQAAA